MTDHRCVRRAMTAVRVASLARVVWGLLLLALPRATVSRLGTRLTSSAERRIARLLGGRHVVQGLLTFRHSEPPWPAMGAVVDVLHAGSMVAVATADCRRAQVALRSAGVATAWALVGASAAAASGDVCGQPRLSGAPQLSER